MKKNISESIAVALIKYYTTTSFWLCTYKDSAHSIMNSIHRDLFFIGELDKDSGIGYSKSTKSLVHLTQGNYSKGFVEITLKKAIKLLNNEKSRLAKLHS